MIVTTETRITKKVVVLSRRRRGRGRADKHVDDAHELPGGCQIPLPDGVEARRAQRHRLETSGHDLFRRVQIRPPEGGRVVPFQHRDEQGARQEQRARHHQHDPRMHQQAAVRRAVDHIEDDGEPQAAHRNKRHDRKIDDRIRNIRLDGVREPEGIKARVAESGNGKENGMEKPVGKPVFRHQPQGRG